MANIHLCKNCGNPIEPTEGKLYPWTHSDPNQTECGRAEHGAALATEQFPTYTLGRIRGVLEMQANPVWKMTHEEAVEKIRAIMATHQAVSRG